MSMVYGQLGRIACQTQVEKQSECGCFTLLQEDGRGNKKDFATEEMACCTQFCTYERETVSIPIALSSFRHRISR